MNDEAIDSWCFGPNQKSRSGPLAKDQQNTSHWHDDESKGSKIEKLFINVFAQVLFVRRVAPTMSNCIFPFDYV